MKKKLKHSIKPWLAGTLLAVGLVTTVQAGVVPWLWQTVTGYAPAQVCAGSGCAGCNSCLSRLFAPPVYAPTSFIPAPAPAPVYWTPAAPSPVYSAPSISTAPVYSAPASIVTPAPVYSAPIQQSIVQSAPTNCAPCQSSIIEPQTQYAPAQYFDSIMPSSSCGTSGCSTPDLVTYDPTSSCGSSSCSTGCSVPTCSTGVVLNSSCGSPCATSSCGITSSSCSTPVYGTTSSCGPSCSSCGTIISNYSNDSCSSSCTESCGTPSTSVDPIPDSALPKSETEEPPIDSRRTDSDDVELGSGSERPDPMDPLEPDPMNGVDQIDESGFVQPKKIGPDDGFDADDFGDGMEEKESPLFDDGSFSNKPTPPTGEEEGEKADPQAGGASDAANQPETPDPGTGTDPAPADPAEPAAGESDKPAVEDPMDDFGDFDEQFEAPIKKKPKADDEEGADIDEAKAPSTEIATPLNLDSRLTFGRTVLNRSVVTKATPQTMRWISVPRRRTVLR